MRISLKTWWLLCLVLPSVSSSPASVNKINAEVARVNAKAAKDAGVPNPEISINQEGEADDGEDEAAAKEKVIQEQLDKIDMPAALNIETFDEVTSQRLTFVEFFSPYCSHCLALAPTWERAYKTFVEEMKLLNIDMRQVNCVESGDLCDREEIFAYPNLRLYSPERDRTTGEVKPNKSKFVDSFPRSLTRTEENFKKYMKNSVAEYNTGSIDLPSASVKIDVDEMLKLITGEHENQEPVFVAFYPATDKQWDKTEESGKSHFDRACRDCLEDKQTWDKLSNHILSIVKSGHFNCLSNPTICEKLGLESLTRVGRKSNPEFVMFLPKSAGMIKFDYRGEISVPAMKQWATKLFQNAQYDIVNARDLTEVMDFRKSLPFEPLNSYYPLNNKLAVVFYYDIDSVTDEDRAILPYLLESVTQSPFNINLYTAKHAKIETNIETQAKNLVEFINYDENATPKKFDKAMHLATTLTSKPTVLIFKDNTLFTSVFQSVAPEDIRDVNKLDKFIRQNQYPLYQELTPQLYKYYFNNRDAETASHKIVVTFIDSEDAQRTNREFYNISLVAHEYHYLKKEYYFNQLNSAREEKYNTVAKLKQQNSDSIKVIRAMRKEIPHLFNEDEVLFTFIDLATNPEFAKNLGWAVRGEKFQPGDSIVVSKDDAYYWNHDLKGNQLVNDPYLMTPVLKYLLDPALVSENFVKLKPTLVGSPYGEWLRFMDYVHGQGFLGYLELIAVLYGVYYVLQKFIGRKGVTGWHLFPKKRNGSQGLGILGADSVLPKKD